MISAYFFRIISVRFPHFAGFGHGEMGMSNIHQVSQRARLTPRREPYWAPLSKGRYVGYRKMTDSSGTWIARYYDEGTRKKTYKALGDFSLVPDHQRYDSATQAAAQWFEHIARGGLRTVTTVEEACDHYVAHQRRMRSDRAADDAARRFKNYVLDDSRLAAMDLAKLTPSHVAAWRKTLQDRPKKSGKPRSDSCFNRDMTCFRAALNLALEDGFVTSNFAWRSKLKPLKGVDRRRDSYLNIDQRRALIGHAPADLALFLRGMSVLPLRPGALAKLEVARYDPRLQTLSIGSDKAGQGRRIALPETTAAFFEQLCKDKPQMAPIFRRSDGKAWNKDAWKHPVSNAVIAANLPAGTTMYTLRHSTITDLIQTGLDTLTVAQISGTSVRMIELYYGHLTREHAKAALSTLAL